MQLRFVLLLADVGCYAAVIDYYFSYFYYQYITQQRAHNVPEIGEIG